MLLPTLEKHTFILNWIQCATDLDWHFPCGISTVQGGWRCSRSHSTVFWTLFLLRDWTKWPQQSVSYWSELSVFSGRTSLHLAATLPSDVSSYKDELTGPLIDPWHLERIDVLLWGLPPRPARSRYLLPLPGFSLLLHFSFWIFLSFLPALLYSPRASIKKGRLVKSVIEEVQRWIIWDKFRGLKAVTVCC